LGKICTGGLGYGVKGEKKGKNNNLKPLWGKGVRPGDVQEVQTLVSLYLLLGKRERKIENSIKIEDRNIPPISSF